MDDKHACRALPLSLLQFAQRGSRGYKLIRQELLAMNAADDTEFMDTVYDDLIASLEPGGTLATLGDDPATPEDAPAPTESTPK
jgi:hypothetical protein